MNRDKKFLAVVVLLVMAAAAFFMIWDDDQEQSSSDQERLTSNGIASEKNKKPSRTDIKRPEVVDVTSPRKHRPEVPREEIKTLDEMGVRHAAIEFIVSQNTGEFLKGAKVELFPLLKSRWTGIQRGAPVSEGTTNAEGYSRLDEIEAQFNYSVHVSAPTFRTFQIPFIKLESGAISRHQVILAQGLSLKGRVISSVNLDAIPDSTIEIYDLEDLTTDPEDAIEWAGTSDSKGEFDAQNLRMGPKRICVRANGFGSKTIPYLAVTPQSSKSVLEFKLQSGAVIAGTVFDLEGKRLANAQVTVSPLRGSAIGDSTAWYAAVSTDSSGAFRCEGLLPGAYALRASKFGYAPGNFGPGNGSKFRLSAANASAGDTSIKLFLGNAPKITGTVTDGRNGNPVQAFDIFSSTLSDPQDLDPSSRQRFVTDDGRFEYSLKVVGTQTKIVYLHIEAPGFAGGKTRVDFTDPAKPHGRLLTRVEGAKVNMASGVSVVGRITDPAGAPVAGVRVSARRRTTSKIAVRVATLKTRATDRWAKAIFDTTDDEGRYEIRAMPNGNFRVVAKHPDFAFQIVEDRLDVQGEPMDMGETRMSLGGTVAGVVLGPEGRPIGSAKVLLEPKFGQGGEPYEWRTNLTGKFAFEHVAAGEFRLTVVERRGLDTRSAIYQDLMKTKPEVQVIEMKDGLHLKFELRN
ncbi:MAG: hypothetical protein ACI97A_001176 [Planctomycetota bacterium]|jgi:hypothetical protein